MLRRCFEAIDALLALAYIGLQIYYGVCYHIQVFKFVANILVLLLVYIANHMAAALSGKAQSHSSGAVWAISESIHSGFDVCKACFTAGLLVPCVCDAFGIAIRDVYNPYYDRAHPCGDGIL